MSGKKKTGKLREPSESRNPVLSKTGMNRVNSEPGILNQQKIMTCWD
jgi:hypothetical protein